MQSGFEKTELELFTFEHRKSDSLWYMDEMEHKSLIKHCPSKVMGDHMENIHDTLGSNPM